MSDKFLKSAVWNIGLSLDKMTDSHYWNSWI